MVSSSVCLSYLSAINILVTVLSVNIMYVMFYSK